MTTNNNVNTSLSGQTGTGNFVGATSPTLITPALGTPSSGTLTSCTGLPAGTGISGLGTNIATALEQNANGSGAISLTTSPTFVTPTLGVATATSINFGGSSLANYVSTTYWTPTFDFVTAGNLSVNYSNQTAYYATIGSILFYTFVMQFTPTFSTASGQAQIVGLPVNNASCYCVGTLDPIAGFTFTGSNKYAGTTSSVGSGVLIIFQAGSGGTPTYATTTSFTSGTSTQLSGSGFYFI